MPSRTPLVTNDPRLSQSLQAAIQNGVSHEFDVFTTATEALDGTQSGETGTLLIDVRPRSCVSDLAELFGRLETPEFRGIRVIALSEGFFPVEAAAQIDRCSAGHYTLPLSQDERYALSERLSQPHRGKCNGYTAPVECKRLQADDLTFFTYDDATAPVLELVERVARHNATLLLVGETGTGKTTLAKIIHRLSGRADEAFQNVACGALPPDLIESELFGHVRGAFTGADRSKLGRFEAAGRGTLLLDEIDVLGPKEQVKLLRVIETGEFEPVGSTQTRENQARLVVASNVDLDTLVRSGTFRSDLYYRLNVLQFRLPSLRERVCDIVPLATYFVRECSRQSGVPVHSVDRMFLDCLKSYSWPGNIRELKNHMHRAVLLCDDGVLTREALSPEVVTGESGGAVGERSADGRSLAERIADIERKILDNELRRHDRSRTETAKALGISRVGLYKKLRKYDLL